MIIKTRKDFCKMAIDNPSQAANKLREEAALLDRCKKVTDITSTLCNVFFISERSVYRDLKK